MLIRVVLFIVFFLWALKAPYAYRDSVRNAVLQDVPEVKLPDQERYYLAQYLAALKSYKAGDTSRTAATRQLAALRYQQMQFPEAEKLYRDLLGELKPKNQLDPEIDLINLRLAEVLTAERNLDEAKSIYLKVLDTDQKYLPKSDLNIARDLNNLGLNAYLMSLSMERGEPRNEKLREANDFYKRALVIYGVQAKTEKGRQGTVVVLGNQYLALRDLEAWQYAQLIKNEEIAIDSQFARPYRLP